MSPTRTSSSSNRAVFSPVKRYRSTSRSGWMTFTLSRSSSLKTLLPRQILTQWRTSDWRVASKSMASWEPLCTPARLNNWRASCWKVSPARALIWTSRNRRREPGPEFVSSGLVSRWKGSGEIQVDGAASDKPGSAARAAAARRQKSARRSRPALPRHIAVATVTRQNFDRKMFAPAFKRFKNRAFGPTPKHTMTPPRWKAGNPCSFFRAIGNPPAPHY